MKTFSLLIAIITLFFVSVSCEKVIDLDLNSTNSKYIIEGTITKDSLIHTVKITKTLDFDESGAYPTVDNAVVTITDDLGNATTLSLIKPGYYRTSNYLGVEGRTYTINVAIDGETFTSSCKMPNQVMVDSLTTQEFSFGPTPVFSLVANRLDPAGVKNYYKFKLYQNDTLIDGIFLQDDEFADGIEILQPIFGGNYRVGDTATLEMMCIDQAIYKYFNNLSVNAGGTGGAVPANPESNFGSDCLGYFSAQTKQRLKKKIQ
jgi:hypothetical protein